MNPFTALPPKARSIIYLGYSMVGLTVGAVQVGYLAAQLPQPTWLTVALAVVPFLGAGLGLTAASNTPTSLSAEAKARQVARRDDLDPIDAKDELGLPDDMPTRPITTRWHEEPPH
jgi:hypothetical protein